MLRNVVLTEDFIQGAISVEKTPEGLRPWRLPFREADLYAEPLVVRAQVPAGVRVAFVSTTQRVVLKLGVSHWPIEVDCVVDDELVQTGVIAPGSDVVRFEQLPPHSKRIELYLSQRKPVIVSGLFIDSDAHATVLEDVRPRWIAYGSSITQAYTAASPAQTWPAIVARRQGLNLTCLGYGGQCHCEPTVARMIRDCPADMISLCLGTNVMGQRSLSRRTFQWAMIGMVKIIHEKHADIPVIVQSPIYCPHRETQENAVGINLQLMREDLQDAVTRIKAAGDSNLYYLDGLSVLGSKHSDLLPDNLHPNADGYRVMADNFEGLVSEMQVHCFERASGG